MSENKKWKSYIHQLRQREIDIIFSNAHNWKFEKILEIGAGDGFQSRLLVNYADSIVCTELDENRLVTIAHPKIEYKICDAERIGSYFPANTFDLIFSSNLFEHLPHPQKALKGISKIMKENGVVILIMPTTFWSIVRFLLYYPVLIKTKIVKIVNDKIQKTVSSKPISAIKTKFARRGNNLKLKDIKSDNKLCRLIKWPKPHGVSKSIFQEFKAFRRKSWTNLLIKEGYTLIKVQKGPVSSGYGLGFNTIRNLLEKLGFAGEIIYFLSKKSRNI